MVGDPQAPVSVIIFGGFCIWSVSCALFIQEGMIVVEALVVGRGLDCREPWNLSEVLRPEFIARPLFLLKRLERGF